MAIEEFGGRSCGKKRANPGRSITKTRPTLAWQAPLVVDRDGVDVVAAFFELLGWIRGATACQQEADKDPHLCPHTRISRASPARLFVPMGHNHYSNGYGLRERI